LGGVTGGAELHGRLLDYRRDLEESGHLQSHHESAGRHPNVPASARVHPTRIVPGELDGLVFVVIHGFLDFAIHYQNDLSLN